MAMREMIDEDGRRWRVWSVRAPIPHLLADVATPTLVREEYRNGWLAFECLDSGERYRVVPIPGGWEGFTDQQLFAVRRTVDPLEPRRRLLD